MENLNNLEIQILKRLAEKYHEIEFHIPFLEVKSREITGVGMYINISYCKTIEKNLYLSIDNASISSNETIEIEGLEYGLSYEVDVENGRIKFIELVTYGEEWNGSISENFFFT